MPQFTAIQIGAARDPADDPGGEAVPHLRHEPDNSDGLDSVLLELEARHQRLCEELVALESRLRLLRTAADLCPLCGGGGTRWVRGGLYGEAQQRPCACRQPE